MGIRSRTVEPQAHTHSDCSNRDRVWLEKEPNATATMVKHPYCVACGTVRDLTWPRSRALGYYLSGIEALKEYLARSPSNYKLVQAQSHLIASRMATRREFEDPYGTPGQAQLDAYVDVVRSVRSDLDEELILRLLPSLRGHSRGETASRDDTRTSFASTVRTL